MRFLRRRQWLEIGMERRVVAVGLDSGLRVSFPPVRLLKLSLAVDEQSSTELSIVKYPS